MTLVVVGALAVGGMVGLAAQPASANGHAEFSSDGPLTFASQALTTTSATQTLTITNRADSNQNSITFGPGAVTLTGTNPSDFVISRDGCSNQTLGGMGTCTLDIAFAPTGLDTRSADLHFIFVGQGRVDPPSPQDVAVSGTGTPAPPAPVVDPLPQTLSSRCAALPSSLPAGGTKRLMKSNCETSAGNEVKVSVTGRMRGDIRLYKVIRRANGATYIKTYGVPARLRVTWSAQATTGYKAYKKVKTYRI